MQELRIADSPLIPQLEGACAGALMRGVLHKAGGEREHQDLGRLLQAVPHRDARRREMHIAGGDELAPGPLPGDPPL